MPMKRPLPVLDPDRIRKPPRSFAWIDHRLRAPGILDGLRPEEIGLYLFLVLAADNDGLSCWRIDRIERSMPCFSPQQLATARNGLIAMNLIAYRSWQSGGFDGSYQVLAIQPPKPVVRGGTKTMADLL